MPTRRLSIIGLGLLGGSIGRAVKQRVNGWEITGYDVSSAAISVAMAVRAIDRGTRDLIAAVADAELVVVATPVEEMPGTFRAIASHLAKSALVTDVGSTKRSICKAAAECLPAGQFVGSHPMAGSEKCGVAESRGDLFDGATCIVTPIPGSSAAAIAQVQAFWQSLGGRPIVLSADDHDAAVARVSHLPHAVAAALVNVQSAETTAVAGKGFADLTRVASGDAALWRGILLDNRDEAAAAIDRLIGELVLAANRLRSGDASALQAWLQAAVDRRRDVFSPDIVPADLDQ